MVVSRLAGPHRGQRNHVRQIQSRDWRLTDVGVNMTRDAAKPGLDRIDRLDHASEIAPLDDLFDEAELLVGGGRIVIPD
jgi:hypothetical protein